MSNQPLSARDRLIVALDFPSAQSGLACVDRLAGTCAWVKVGLELYLAAGPSLLDKLLHRNLKVFLDLKLHDIPNTVAGAVRSLSSSGVDLLTVHAAGGQQMLQAAAAAAAEMPGAPRLLAVSVLTSMDDVQLRGIGVSDPPAVQVLRLARLARAAGISGMVCSPLEAASLRAENDSTLLVVPGIRSAGATADDQSRTATASAAIRAGASMLVVGRPITQAADPAAAAQALLDEIEQAAQA